MTPIVRELVRSGVRNPLILRIYESFDAPPPESSAGGRADEVFLGRALGFLATLHLVKRIGYLRILLIPTGLFLNERKNRLIASISIQELWQLCRSGQKPEIVDVRSETEFAAVHIPGAKCIPLPQLPLRHADLGDGDLVLVCEAGTRACIAHKSLSQRSGRVFVLDGGTRAWREAGLPTIALLRTHWSLERQVRLGAGVMILIGMALTLLVSKVWLLIPAFTGAGLTFAGATDICMMGTLLAHMPWNQLRNSDVQRA